MGLALESRLHINDWFGHPSVPESRLLGSSTPYPDKGTWVDIVLDRSGNYSALQSLRARTRLRRNGKT